MYERSAESIAGGERYRRWRDAALAQINGHPSSDVLAKWGAAVRSYDVWQLNMLEMLALLDDGERDQEFIMAIFKDRDEKTPQVRKFWGQFDQRMHNVVASTGTLIAMQLRLTKRLPDEFVSEYKVHLQPILNDPQSMLVSELRNYTLHRGHAPIGTTTTFLSGEVSNRFEIRPDVLLKDPKLAVPTKRYLSSLAEDIPLSPVLRKYMTQMTALYGWLNAQYDRVIEPHRLAVNVLRRAYDDMGSEPPAEF